MQLLLDKGVGIDYTDEFLDPPLTQALLVRDVAMIKPQLDYETDPRSKKKKF